MNPKVQALIDQKRKEEDFKKDKKSQEDGFMKEQYLLSLGLIDEEKSSYKKTYKDEWEDGCLWDEDKEQWYKEESDIVLLDISDEEYQTLLKYYPPTECLVGNTAKDKTTTEITCSEIITVTAKIFLVVTIIGCLILAFMVDDSFWVWVVIVLGIINTLYYPLIIGFSKIVAAAEKYLEK